MKAESNFLISLLAFYPNASIKNLPISQNIMKA